MKILGVVYFLLATGLFLVVKFPREDVVRSLIEQNRERTGVGLQWNTGVFGLRSAHLEGVLVTRNREPVANLDKVDLALNPASVDYLITQGAGRAWGTADRSAVTVQAAAFPLPVPANTYVKNVALSSASGRFNLANSSGAGTLEATGEALNLFNIHGTLRATGDFTLKNGNLELHAGLVGDKVQGRLEGTATSQPSAPGIYVLDGTLQLNYNGQPMSFRIAGSSAAPQLTPVMPGMPAVR